MSFLDSIIDIADFMWSNIIGYVLLGVGLYYTIRLGFPPDKICRRDKESPKEKFKK